MNEQAYAAYRALYGPGDGDRTAKLFVRRYVAPALDGDRSEPILEVGSGTGEAVRALRSFGWTSVRGSDASPAQVEESRRRGTEIELGGAIEVLGRQPAASLAGILALDVFEHMPYEELESFCKLCLSKLRQGGRLVVRVPNGAGVFGGCIRYGDLTHLRAFTESSLRQLFAIGGLTPLVFRPCRPLVHGPVSAARWLAWLSLEALFGLAHAAESGSPRVFVTRNIVAVARRS